MHSTMLFDGMQKVVFILIVLMLSACGVSFYDRPSGSEANVGSGDTQISEPPQTLHIPQTKQRPSAAGAIEQLLAQSNQALADKHYERAAAMAERVIRIAPTDPRGYFALAQISHFQQQLGLSKSLLLKAESLAVNDASLAAAIEKFRHENH